jgi:hypothetical protein
MRVGIVPKAGKNGQSLFLSELLCSTHRSAHEKTGKVIPTPVLRNPRD